MAPACADKPSGRRMVRSRNFSEVKNARAPINIDAADLGEVVSETSQRLTQYVCLFIKAAAIKAICIAVAFNENRRAWSLFSALSDV